MARLRRSASISRIQRVWGEWRTLPREFSETDMFSMSLSERSSPLRRFSDDEGGGMEANAVMNNPLFMDDEAATNGLTLTFHRRRSGPKA